MICHALKDQRLSALGLGCMRLPAANGNDAAIDEAAAAETAACAMERKAQGRIRHPGFSAHGAPETMKRFPNAYGREAEF